MSKARALWQLTRLEHGFMLAIGILVGALIASQVSSQAFPSWDILLLTFLTALFLGASTFALNDYFDYDIDVANGRMDRPLARGALSKGAALAVFALLFPLGIACSFFVNTACFAIALITGILAIAYDVALKKHKYVGNFYIAYTMAVPFAFGSVAAVPPTLLDLSSLAQTIPPAVAMIFLIAFLSGAGREVMKDAQDVDGDRRAGVRSFATAMGVRGALALSATFYFFAVAMSLIPFIEPSYALYHFDIYYIAPVIVTDAMLVFVSASILRGSAPNLKLHRRLTLAALFIGLIGFLFGAYL